MNLIEKNFGRVLVVSMWLPLEPVIPEKESTPRELKRKLSVYVKHHEIHEQEINLESATVGNGGLINAIASVPDLKHIWIGSLQKTLDQYDKDDQLSIKNALWKNNCVAVDISKEQLQGHYHHFCKVVLWPLFHYSQPDYMTITKFEDHNWLMYQKVNYMYAQQIAQTYKDGDVVFINDYHLMLVPQMLRLMIPDAKIGFFLHIPFPSSEIFRCLYVRDEILLGPTGADVIGFQTYSFARHFLQTCSRLLNLDTTPNTLRLASSVVSIHICPIGVDVKQLHKKLENDLVISEIDSLKQKYNGFKVIFGRDKCDTIKGVKEKLLAYELFLSTFPEWIGKVVFIQIGLSTVTDTEIHITDIISRINMKWGTLDYNPVNYLAKDISFSNYLALMSIADVALITPLRDGLNLTSHEFVIAQKSKYSPLILSEFAGTFGSFGAALRVNPFHINEVAMTINDALCMPLIEKQQRWELLHDAICRYSASRFVNTFIDLININSIDMQKRYSSHIPHMNINKIKSDFGSSTKPFFFLDLEGSIDNSDNINTRELLASARNSRSFTNLEEIKQPLGSIETCLSQLSKQNNVLLISSKRKEALESRFGGTDVVLAAENGCFIKFPGSEWECKANMELEWRDTVIELLEYYTEVFITYIENAWVLYRS